MTNCKYLDDYIKQVKSGQYRVCKEQIQLVNFIENEKTGCIWVPAIAHGAFNAIAALPQVLVTPADAYYNVLGPMPIGLDRKSVV